MFTFFRRIVLFCVFFTSFRLASTGADNVIDPKWIKPGALDRWEQEQRQRENTEVACEAQAQPVCDCPPPPFADKGITEDQLALVFYRKLVTTLFARDALQLEPFGAFYTSDLSLKLTTRQLDKLINEASSARDIDATVSEIIEQSINIRRSAIEKEHRCEQLYNYLVDFAESRFFHNILPIVLMVVACYIVRVISRFSRMHPILVLLLLVFSISVLNKWKECNEKLAKSSLDQLDTASSHQAWYMIGRGSEICDPMQVLVEVTVSVQAVYFKTIFKEYLGALNEFTANAGFFDRIAIGLLLSGFSYVVLTVVLQAGVTSGFRLFGNVATAVLSPARNAALANDGANAPQQQLPAVNLNIHIGDPAAGGQQRIGVYRAESQRIEIVSDEQYNPPPSDTAPLPAIEEKQEKADTEEAEPSKSDGSPGLESTHVKDAQNKTVTKPL